MKIKRFVASNMRDAMKAVKEKFGDEGIIISNREVGDKVEILATTREEQEQHAIISSDKQSKQNTSFETTETIEHTSTEQVINNKAEPEVRLAESQLATESLTQAIQASRANQEKQQRTQESPISDIQTEIKYLRGLLEQQLASTGYRGNERYNSTQAILLRQLAELGLTTKMCKRIVNKLPEKGNLEKKWRSSLDWIENEITTVGKDVLDVPGVVAVVGPTGVGKTTTIAKLAARFVLLNGSSDVALITTDSYRIAAYEQLKTYANILEVPVRLVESISALREALWEYRQKQLILIDTAGMSQRDVRLTEQLEVLQEEIGMVRTYLTLSATSQWSVMDESVRIFKKSGIHGCIITKIDECSSLGEVVSVIVEHNLPIGYITTGQCVPEDIFIARPEELVNEMVRLGKKHRSAIHDKSLAEKLMAESAEEENGMMI